MTGSDELCWVPAAELAQRIRNGEVTPMDVTEQVVARIEAVNPEVNAFINFDRNKVLEDAGRLTEAQRRGDALGPRHGGALLDQGPDRRRRAAADVRSGAVERQHPPPRCGCRDPDA